MTKGPGSFIKLGGHLLGFHPGHANQSVVERRRRKKRKMDGGGRLETERSGLSGACGKQSGGAL